MDAQHIQDLLIRFGCEKIRVGPRAVTARCPFGSHPDKNPSFFVMIDDGGHSGWGCKAGGCAKRGYKLRLLLDELRRRRPGLPWGDLAMLIEEHDRLSPARREAEAARLHAEPPPPREVAGITVSGIYTQDFSGAQLELPALPEAELEQFELPSGEGLAFLEKRGLRPATLEAWGLRWHAASRRIAIPIRDRTGKLVGISGRTIDDVKPKFLHSSGFKRDYYLFGEHLCQTPGVGYLVEGFFDAIALWQAGYRNALCFMGSGVSKFHVEKIVQLCERVIIVPDGDKPGDEIATRVQAAVVARVWKTRVVAVPSGYDPDQLSAQELEDLLGPPQAAPTT